MAAIVIYSLLIFLVGVVSSKKSQNLEEYATGGRSFRTVPVMFSLTASCVGGSATIGLAALTWEVGFPAFWYLGVGVIGLMVLGRFLVGKVVETGAKTLPEMIETFIAPEGRTIGALIITLAWTAILAAQFSAGARIIGSLGGVGFSGALLFTFLFITLYTLWGGQISVIRSDLFQFALVLGSLILLLVYFLLHYPLPGEALRVELFNENFGGDTWCYYQLIMGGSYIVCPMLFGRLLSAKSPAAAKRGTYGAALLLLLTALLIVVVSLYGKSFLPPSTEPDQFFTAALVGELPYPLGVVLLLALFSAIISSADSCLITASTILTNDLLKRDSLKVCRLVSLLLGLLAYGLSTFDRGILSLLFAANDIYVSGIVAPVFLAMLFYPKIAIPKVWTLSAMVLGGSLGLAGALSGEGQFSLAGVGVSFLLSLTGALLRKGEKVPLPGYSG
ncbi:MAG: sodium:solute symporter family protein [Spirochaetales bacterium]|nr:sodium:solute symporter family protein [Spirochaetales bacterium]